MVTSANLGGRSSIPIVPVSPEEEGAPSLGEVAPLSEGEATEFLLLEQLSGAANSGQVEGLQGLLPTIKRRASDNPLFKTRVEEMFLIACQNGYQEAVNVFLSIPALLSPYNLSRGVKIALQHDRSSVFCLLLKHEEDFPRALWDWIALTAAQKGDENALIYALDSDCVTMEEANRAIESTEHPTIIGRLVRYKMRRRCVKVSCCVSLLAIAAIALTGVVYSLAK